ncbi:MAG TPA: hypothetical protein PLD84_01095 [Chitinophagales bacterium]|nr:hypothetical protein [Chitinophagales bacterium]
MARNTGMTKKDVKAGRTSHLSPKRSNGSFKETGKRYARQNISIG